MGQGQARAMANTDDELDEEEELLNCRARLLARVARFDPESSAVVAAGFADRMAREGRRPPRSTDRSTEVKASGGESLGKEESCSKVVQPEEEISPERRAELEAKAEAAVDRAYLKPARARTS